MRYEMKQQNGYYSSERVEWVDLGKGFGILLVVLGHCLISPIRESSVPIGFLYNIIYYMHMPFLMFLSGYASTHLSKSRALAKELSIKVKKLLIPYIAYAITVYLVFFLASRIHILSSLIEKFINMDITLQSFLGDLLTANLRLASHLWYIYVLFIFYMIQGFARKWTWLNTKIHVFVGLLLYLFKNHWDISACTVFNNAFSTYIWFSLGAYGFSGKIHKTRYSFLKFIVGLTYGIINICLLSETKGPLKYLWSILTIGARYLIITGLAETLSGLKLSKSNFISYIGRNSFSIYLLHQPFLCLCGVSFMHMFLPNPVAITLGFALGVGLPLLLNRICKNDKSRSFY